MTYYLGIDIGGTKSHAMITDSAGVIHGFGEAGAGNHEQIGFDGLARVLNEITAQALRQAGISRDQIAGAGFGLCGYDWPSERQPHLDAIATLGLACPVEAVNDAVIGLIAGARSGWGVCIVAGTSCNAWGRDVHGRYGHVIGMGGMAGEGAGGSEIVHAAIVAICHAYTRRGAPTALTQTFCEQFALPGAGSLIEAYCENTIDVSAYLAPLVFKTADSGDAVARDIIQWAGRELGTLAVCVARQLDLESQPFEVVTAGSIFKGGSLLYDSLQAYLSEHAPYAVLVPLRGEPLIGAVLLGMECGGLSGVAIQSARERLSGE